MRTISLGSTGLAMCTWKPAARARVRSSSRAWAVTAAAGTFTLDGVPPGTYRVRAWHPMLGLADGVVVVARRGMMTPQ